MGFIKTIFYSILFAAIVGLLFTTACANMGITLGGF